MQRTLFGLGAFFGFSAVAMASLAAHGLAGVAAARVAMVQSALQMQGWHALALLGTALWLPRGGRLTAAAGLCFATGVGIFCVTVYGLGFGLWATAWPAPIGGTLLLAGWALLLAGAWRGDQLLR